LVLVQPLCALQQLRRPSPFPEKNRERDPAALIEERAPRRFGGTQPVRVKPCASIGVRTTSAAAAPVATGKASFFTSSADGALAGGGRLDAEQLGAAHATYPLGTLVKVTNLANGETVEVRIVDRFQDSRRIINVSEAAAKRLGFVKAGTAEVRVERADRHAASADRK
jgi:rare lipoprotein A